MPRNSKKKLLIFLASVAQDRRSKTPLMMIMIKREALCIIRFPRSPWHFSRATGRSRQVVSLLLKSIKPNWDLITITSFVGNVRWGMQKRRTKLNNFTRLKQSNPSGNQFECGPSRLSDPKIANEKIWRSCQSDSASLFGFGFSFLRVTHPLKHLTTDRLI